MSADLVPLHMGALHAYEQWLVAGIAFGPFIVLAVVIAVVRRRDAADEVTDQPPGEEGPVTNG